MRFSDDRHAAPATLSPSPARRRGTLAVLLAVAGAAALSACGSGISLDEPIESRVWRLARLGQQPVAAGADPQRDPQVQFSPMLANAAIPSCSTTESRWSTVSAKTT